MCWAQWWIRLVCCCTNGWAKVDSMWNICFILINVCKLKIGHISWYLVAQKAVCTVHIGIKFLPFNHSRMPWNQKTPLGYFFEIVASVFAGGSYFITTGALLVMFISICLHHQAFYQMFVHALDELDHLAKGPNVEKHLCELIRFHTSIRG